MSDVNDLMVMVMVVHSGLRVQAIQKREVEVVHFGQFVYITHMDICPTLTVQEDKSSLHPLLCSSVASPICQEGQSEKTFPTLPLFPDFFPLFPDFLPIFPNFFSVKRGTLPP